MTSFEFCPPDPGSFECKETYNVVAGDAAALSARFAMAVPLRMSLRKEEAKAVVLPDILCLHRLNGELFQFPEFVKEIIEILRIIRKSHTIVPGVRGCDRSAYG